MKILSYCKACAFEHEGEEVFECPECGEMTIRFPVVSCECGEEVICQAFTNICECGRMFNRFGQELAPINEWEPEDVYGTFGPQGSDIDY